LRSPVVVKLRSEVEGTVRLRSTYFWVAARDWRPLRA
jgi:hypothetical protein